MKKGKARRHREARSLKQAGWLPPATTTVGEDVDEGPAAESSACDECAGVSAHASWCLVAEQTQPAASIDDWDDFAPTSDEGHQL
jgi:hypothetical protein